MFVAWIWIATLSGSAALHRFTYWLLLLVAGGLANMAIVHRGCCRSFAIGTMVTMLVALFNGRSFLTTIVSIQGGAFGPSMRPDTLLTMFWIEVTLAILSGLMCAMYYNIMYYNIVMRVRAAEPAAKPALPATPV